MDEEWNGNKNGVMIRAMGNKLIFHQWPENKWSMKEMISRNGICPNNVWRHTAICLS